MTAKYELIDAEKAGYAIVDMCSWLGVSRSGYYEWRGRPLSATAERRERLKEKIQGLFDDSHQTYGYRRIHAALLRCGERVSHELVRHLMRELGLRPGQSRPWRPVTTLADGSFRGIPDLVRRDFTAERPGVKLVGDITYIPTWEGFVYLATVIDCHSKMVAGWAMADHYKASLVCDAIDAAAGTVELQPGCILIPTAGRTIRVRSSGGIWPGMGYVGRSGVRGCAGPMRWLNRFSGR